MLNQYNLEKLDEVKQVISSLLIANGDREVKLQLLNKIYKEVTDEDIPFIEYNYTSLKDFLSSLSDVLYLDYNKKDDLCVYPNKSEKTQHITDLVKKQKKSHEFSNRSRVKRVNLIDPLLLFDILKFSKDSIYFTYKKQKCVRKIDLLTQINKNVDLPSAYTLADLSNQLTELTHLLTHDDELIYFKENSEFNSVSDFIKKNTKTRLLKLLEKFPNGIWCQELPNKYLTEFKLDLEYCDLGFNSIIEFIQAMPDILRVITPPNSQHLKVIDLKNFEKTPQSFQSVSSCETYKTEDTFHSFQRMNPHKLFKIEDKKISKLSLTLDNLSCEQNKILILDDSINSSDSVDQIFVRCVHKPSTKYVKVIVSEVHSPSFFWVTLYDNKEELKELMNQLQEFYGSQSLDQFVISPEILQPGLHIACKYEDLWHRGIIKKVGSKRLTIFFYDFGTVSKNKAEKAYLLDKRFIYLPAQAILCGLSKIMPKKSDENKWPTDVSQQFLEKILYKKFYATISFTNEQNNSMMIDLVDKNKTRISEWMVKEKLAKYGDVLCTKKNPHFKNY